MELHISLVGRKNLRAEIYRQLREAIVTGRLRLGDRLPATRELAQSLGVARMTVIVAYDRLAGEGFVTARVGHGTVVSERVVPQPHQGKRHRTGGALRPRTIWDSIWLSRNYPGAPARFDFRIGVPDESLFPHGAWRRLMARELRVEAVGSRAYGHPAGHPGLREAIARHLSASRGMDTSADDTTVTSGTQQALDIVARVLLAPGDRIAVEDPGYVPPQHLFRSMGAQVIGVPVDHHGIVVDAIPRNTRVVYVTPSHQYPLGVVMTLPRRLALLAWAEKNDAAIIEDDYDSEFRFGARPIEPLRLLDSNGRVVYVGSFSKTMRPALRLGFVVTPPSLRDAVHRAKYVTDWHTPMLAQAALARFMEEGGYARHIRKMRSVYQTRRDMILKTLARNFADRLEVMPSVAGLHLAAVARSATVERIDEVARQAAKAGVAVQQLSACAVGGPGRAGLMLGYGAVSTTRIAEGLRRLRACFDG